MKKIVMTMVALLTMTVAVAQNNENGQRRGFQRQTPEEMTNRMADQLKLDDKQKSKVLDLNKEYESVLAGPGMGRGFGRGQGGPGGPGGFQGGQQGQRPQLTDEQRAEMQKMMQERMEKRQEYEKKLQKILTDDQFKTYQEQQQRRGRGGFGGGQGGPRGQRPNM
jgi:Spy/CpxP family protein refolding chaperone